MITAITQVKIVRPDGIVNGTILMENGRLLAAGRVLPPQDAMVHDAHGQYAGPGFVDIHCHGGGTELGHEQPQEAAAHHLAHGTTSLLLSLAYSLTKEQWIEGISKIKAAMNKPRTSLAGIHFEGPDTNPRYGARARLAWQIDRADYRMLFELAKGLVRQCTYAPELDGARDFARYVRSLGITLAAGHTEMSPAVLAEAIADGVTLVTHLYDAMGCHLGNDSVRQTGIIQDSAADAALAQDGLYYELICDSRAVHVKPANLKLACRAAGPDRLILVTDATIQAHNPADYPAADPRSSVDLNYNAEGELSGSCLTMDQACRNMKKHTGASVTDLFQMAAANPARATGLYASVGSLEPGKQANLVLCDANINLSAVYLDGQRISEASSMACPDR